MLKLKRKPLTGLLNLSQTPLFPISNMHATRCCKAAAAQLASQLAGASLRGQVFKPLHSLKFNQPAGLWRSV